MKYLSELICEERTKEASTMLPLMLMDALRHPNNRLEGAGIGAIRSIPTDLGLGLGIGVGGLLGELAGGRHNHSPLPLLAGAGLGALAGGAAGYAVSDPLLRMVLGEEKYNELFDKERARNDKNDPKVLT